MATRTRNRNSASDCADPGLLLQQGESLREQGKYEQAEACLLRAIEVLERDRGKSHLDTAVALNSLGVLYKYLGRFAAGGRACRRALRIVERAIHAAGEEPPLVHFLATLYHNLGGLEHSRGRYSQGEPFARRSVEWRRTVAGEDDPLVAADQAALAALLDGQGKYAEAESLYLAALAVFERHYGAEHYEVCINLNNLAALYQLRGEADRAEPLYRRALQIKQKLLGRRHPDVAMTLHNLSVLRQEQGDSQEARRLSRRAVAVFRHALQADHPKLRAAERHLSQLLGQQE